MKTTTVLMIVVLNQNDFAITISVMATKYAIRISCHISILSHINYFDIETITK